MKKLTYEESLERFNKIIILRNQGVPTSTIGKMFGVTGSRIAQIKEAPKPPKRAAHIWNGAPKWLQQGRERTREQVRARDGYKCSFCKKKWEEGTRRFDIHHIMGMCGKKSRSYDKLSEMDSLITLCHKCHMAYHVLPSRYNRKNPLKNKTEEIKAMLSEGKSRKFIGRHFKVTETAITLHLLKYAKV